MTKINRYTGKEFELLDPRLEDIGRKIVNAAFIVHKALGPGLLEKIYEVCLYHELRKVGLNPERQLDLPIEYDGLTFDEGLRLDVLVDKDVIIEIKAVDQTNPVWEAQLLSHLKLLHKRLGYLINFNVPLIKNGIKRKII